MKLHDLFRSRLLLRQAKALHDDGRIADAASAYRSVLALDGRNWTALNALAALALHAGDLEEAIRRLGDMLERRPDFAEGHYKRGNALNRMGRWQAALADYDRAVTLDPCYAKAFCNRGTVLEQLGQLGRALDSYERAIALDPLDAFAYYNRASVLKKLTRLAEAVDSYDRAIALKQDYAEAYVNRGHLLHRMGLLEEAAASYGKALELRPVFIPRSSADQPARLDPEQKNLLGLRRHTRMQICDWRDMDADLERLTEGLRARLPVCLPFPALALVDSPSLHRAAAESWIREEAPPDNALGPIAARGRSPKIRIGYFSGDFRVHPVALLTAGLFERHDRYRFEIFAFAFGPKSNDQLRARLVKAFDRFVDVCDQTETEVATLARDMGIDIAVDLTGITEHGRSKIFALRAAPIQINFLGYPGTMGAGYMDYLVADRTVIPHAQQQHYLEKIIYLPDSFIPFDSTYAVSDKVFTRQELGLPPEGFVFCCFNNTFKITPEVFDVWMRILTRSEKSVLWLAPGNPTASENLRKEASRRGVEPERLIFAGRMASLPEHLARHRAADLFLDTHPYNAHTSALDALWSGLPMLTYEGQSFASRVAASALRTIGLPELIAGSMQQYEDKAVELAANPALISQIRVRLAQNRSTTALFDTERYARNLELAYREIHDRYHSGVPPAHIDVC
jgi:predicted O-linked N-acetylglucosamine transferase (SPINDLY family)